MSTFQTLLELRATMAWIFPCLFIQNESEPQIPKSPALDYDSSWDSSTLNDLVDFPFKGTETQLVHYTQSVSYYTDFFVKLFEVLELQKRELPALKEFPQKGYSWYLPFLQDYYEVLVARFQYEAKLDFEIEQINNHIEDGLPSFRSFNSIECLAANVLLPKEQNRSERKVHFDEEDGDAVIVDVVTFDAEMAPDDILPCASNYEMATSSRFCSKTKAENPEPTEAQIATIPMAQLEDEVFALAKESQISEEDDAKVDEMITKFTDVHEKLSTQFNAGINTKFHDFAKKFKLARTDLDEMSSFCFATFTQLEQQVGQPQNLAQIAGDILFITECLENINEELLFLRDEMPYELEEIKQELFSSMQCKDIVEDAYERFFDCHCRQYDLDEDELHYLFNKNIFDRATLLQNSYTDWQVEAVYRNYIGSLENAHDWLKHLNEMMTDLIRGLGICL